MDFTQKKYKELLENIKAEKINVYGIKGWINSKPAGGIMIRHDVDRNAINSLRIANLEAEFGFSTTYYFRITSGSFKPQIIKEIKKLGHEIGYHYEDLSLANGDIDKALLSFQSNLKKFAKFSEIKTIAMHGRPLSKYTNKDMWKDKSFKTYGIEADAFLSVDYSDVYYFTDTGRSWSSNSINLRDKVEGLNAEVANTNELIEFIKKNKLAKIALVTHPERWNDPGIGFLHSWLMDKTANSIKYLIKKLNWNK
jgi:hypothetical protein